ncbi:hypothetical protein JB92DRAFT_3116387 [Gautieria morchelliformis]|nr:hypothetical protein JB92DRAFT_3116387 [Gautieria morchelliformis]
MSDRLPASLAYLLIYNPTLPPPQSAPRDDEDAQEEAHILFYTSRERVVSRDRMLRQVGLAKALVNFSEIFKPGQGCDNVHSQGKRMVSVLLEPDFWMHVCVDLAKTRKPKAKKSKAVKDTDLPPQGYYHHEESVHDLALRHYLLKGYESFKLLHGTCSSILRDSEPGTLETHLEHFFTPWAWNWDFESINEFGTHLGLALHPLNPSLSPLFSSFVDKLPPKTIPILLSPPYVIDSSQNSAALYPSSLPRYLLSLASSSGRPTLNTNAPKRQKSSRSSTPNPQPGSADTGVSNNTLGFLSAAGVGMGEVMNVKKWSWPGALTFGKTGSTSRNKLSPALDDHTLGSQNNSPGKSSGEQSAVAVKERRSNSCAVQHIHDHLEASVDQSALDDAFTSLASREPAVVTETNFKGDSRTLPDEAQANNMPSSIATTFSPNAGSDCLDAIAPRSLTTTSHPPGPGFSTLSVFLSDSSTPSVVRRRRVLHMSLFQLVFALVMDAEWPADGLDERLESLAHMVSGFLEKVRTVIDTESMHSTNLSVKNGPDRSRHIISSSHHTIFSNNLFSSTSSLFFESQQTLARDSDVLEIFSRSTNPQHWFVAKRGLGFNSAGDRIPGEAYLQTNNKEASLVEADNELVGAVRRWAHTED